MDPERARALYYRWLPGMWHAEAADMDRLARELFTPDAVAHWNGHTVRGPEGVAEQMRASTTMFRDIHTTVDVGPIVEGDLLAAKWTFRGTYAGGLDTDTITAPEGTVIEFDGTDTFRIRDARFAEYWPQGDNLACMSQLGAVAAPQTAPRE